MNDEESARLECPNCRAPLYEDAPRCPSCGDYVTPGRKRTPSFPAWMWIGLILAVLVLLSWVLAG